MYVSNENEVVWEAEEDFQVLEEERQNRIRDILKELLSTAVTVKTHPAAVEQNLDLYGLVRGTGAGTAADIYDDEAFFEEAYNKEQQENRDGEEKIEEMAWDGTSLQREDGGDPSGAKGKKAGSVSGENVLRELQKDVLEAYTHTDPYYALAAEIIYDVPGRAEDHEDMFDASDETYTALLGAICPAKLSKAALGYSDQMVGQLERRWEIFKPAAGFLYPSFRDRATDLSEAVFYTKTPGNEPVLYRIFSVREEDVPETKNEKKENLAELLSEAELSLEEAAIVTESIQEMAEENPEAVLGNREIAHILQEDTEAEDDFLADLYQKSEGPEMPVSVAAEKKIRIKTESCEVSIQTDHAELIREEMIEGVRYICVPADGDVTVNGIHTVYRGEEKQGTT